MLQKGTVILLFPKGEPVNNEILSKLGVSCWRRACCKCLEALESSLYEPFVRDDGFGQVTSPPEDAFPLCKILRDK